MTEKVGGIEYAIDIDISKLTTSINAVQASTKRMEDSFSGVDTAVKKMQRELSAAGKTITKSGNVVDNFGMINKKLTQDLHALIAKQKDLKSSTQNVDNTYKKLNQTANQTGRGLQDVSRKAGMAGVQIEQFVGQVQGGGDIMRAFSYQATDLGIVLGAPLAGAAVGLGAALLAVLVPSLMTAKDSTEELEKAMEALRRTASKSEGGIYDFTDSIKDLSKVGKFTVAAQIEADMIRADNAVTSALESIRDEFASGVGATKFLGFIGQDLKSLIDLDLGNVADFSGSIISTKALGKALGATNKDAYKLGQEIVGLFADVQRFKTPESLTALQNRLSEISSSSADEKIKLLVSDLQLFFAEGRVAGETAAFLKKQFDKLSESGGIDLDIDETNNKLTASKSLISSLSQELQVARLNSQGNTEAADELATAFSIGLNSAEELPAKARELLAEMRKIGEQEKANAIAGRQEENLEKVLVAYQNQAAQLELNNKQLDEYNARRRLGLEDGEQIPANIQAEIDALELLRVKKAEMSEQAKAEKVIEQEFKTLNTGLESGGMTELEKIQADFEAKRALIQEHTAILMQDDELTAQQKAEAAKNAAGLITDIEENAASARERIAESEQASKLKAVSSAFGSLSSLMNTESKKLFEIGKAAAIAGAIVDGYAAIQGAYKVGSKLGGPPVGAAFAAASAVQTAVQVQGIAKQKIGGAKTMGATSSFQGGVPTANTGGSGGMGDRNVSISGLDPSSMFSGEQVRELLKNLAGDGADFTFLNGGG